MRSLVSFSHPLSPSNHFRPLDILRECRGDNKRLIAYLCQPPIVSALVAHSVTSKQSLAIRAAAINHPPAAPEHNAEQSVQNGQSLSDNSVSTPADAQVIEDKPDSSDVVDDNNSDTNNSPAAGVITVTDAATNDNPKPPSNPMKYPYVASELLSADIRELCDVVVGNDSVMDIIFKCVEANQPGYLDPFVATHFSKVIVSLLKTRNAQTLQQMKRRGRAFTDGLIKHIALGPISELIVRLLDAPEQERSYDTTIYPPSPGAISLVTSADLLNGLAESFVQASHPLRENESPPERRHREETLANVTNTINGLTERILQLPPLGVKIPEQLSAYHSPKAIARLLDAGLFAVTSGATSANQLPDGEEPDSPTTVSVPAQSVVLSGNYSALLHSLGLAANLMTTKNNTWEEEKLPYDMHNSDISHDDPSDLPGATEEAAAENGASLTENSTPAGLGTSNLLRPRTPGESIISTSHLEQELVVRFRRLAAMFGSLESDLTSKLPLGSLRLKLAEFFTSCMKKASRTTVEHIIELGVPSKLLELFRRYEWSSMLHGVVTSSIISALEAGMSGLPARIAWCDAQLVAWLLAAWSKNTENEADEDCRFRAGYMGHLIKIGAALRNFVCETERTNSEALFQLVSKENVEKFKTFSEECLAPAHRIEVTPLCDNESESEEIYEEEPTDLLESGVGEVIEGLTQGDPGVAIQRFSKFLLYKSGGNLELNDEEEDITTVDVGDLSHFGDDEEEEVEEVEGVDVDHDLPPEMRASLYGTAENTTGTDGKSEPNGVVPKANEDGDDDGSYLSHMKKNSTDKDKEAGKTEVDKLSESFKESVRIVEPLRDVVVPIPSPSLEVDAAVTEIEEPSPVTPSVLTPLQTHSVPTRAEGGDESSDEDNVDNWVAFEEYEKKVQAQGSQGGASAAAASKGEAAAPIASGGEEGPNKLESTVTAAAAAAEPTGVTTSSSESTGKM